MKDFRVILFFIFPFCSSAQTSTIATAPKQIDVVIAMDLSGSTNGLLDNFRDKFWDIVNQCYMLQPRPQLRFGVVGCSRPSFKGAGLTKIICDLTDDYDLLTGELYKLKSSVENGYQFMGFTLHTSVYDMNWSQNPNAIKIIFIVGNGKVNCGAYDFRKAYDEAKQNNIIVNSVYCARGLKNELQNEVPGWNEIAEQTGGELYSIMVNKRAPLVAFNGDIGKVIQLDEDFNGTILPYGKDSKDRFKRTQELDQYMLNTYDGYFLSRLYYKVSDHYNMKQQGWDATSKFLFGRKPSSDELSYILRASPDSLAPNTSILQQLIIQDIDDRKQIKEDVTGLFPVERLQKVIDDYKEEKFDYNLMFDRAIIDGIYRQALVKGFSL